MNKADFLRRESFYPLCMASGGFNFTHWQKKSTPNSDLSIPSGVFNDDAWAASPFFSIVCDGVSSIRSLGYDGFRLPKELTMLLMHHITLRHFKPNELRELILSCAKECVEIGSTTCTLAILDDKTNTLYGLAFGDSSLHVLRQSHNYRYKVVFESSAMSLSFNKPFQINTKDRPVNPKDLEQWLISLKVLLDACPLIQFPLEPGDLVIVASDGFSDNIDTRMIERTVNTTCFPSQYISNPSNSNSNTIGTVNPDSMPFSNFIPDPSHKSIVGENTNSILVPTVSTDLLSKSLVREALKWGCCRVFDSKIDGRWVDNDLIVDKWPSILDWSTPWVKKAVANAKDEKLKVDHLSSNVNSSLNNCLSPKQGIVVRLTSSHDEEIDKSKAVRFGGKPDDITVVCSYILPCHLKSRLTLLASQLYNFYLSPHESIESYQNGVYHLSNHMNSTFTSNSSFTMNNPSHNIHFSSIKHAQNIVSSTIASHTATVTKQDVTNGIVIFPYVPQRNGNSVNIPNNGENHNKNITSIKAHSLSSEFASNMSPVKKPNHKLKTIKHNDKESFKIKQHFPLNSNQVASAKSNTINHSTQSWDMFSDVIWELEDQTASPRITWQLQRNDERNDRVKKEDLITQLMSNTFILNSPSASKIQIPTSNISNSCIQATLGPKLNLEPSWGVTAVSLIPPDHNHAAGNNGFYLNDESNLLIGLGFSCPSLHVPTVSNCWVVKSSNQIACTAFTFIDAPFAVARMKKIHFLSSLSLNYNRNTNIHNINSRNNNYNSLTHKAPSKEFNLQPLELEKYSNFEDPPTCGVNAAGNNISELSHPSRNQLSPLQKLENNFDTNKQIFLEANLDTRKEDDLLLKQNVLSPVSSKENQRTRRMMNAISASPRTSPPNSDNDNTKNYKVYMGETEAQNSKDTRTSFGPYVKRIFPISNDSTLNDSQLNPIFFSLHNHLTMSSLYSPKSSASSANNNNYKNTSQASSAVVMNPSTDSEFANNSVDILSSSNSRHAHSPLPHRNSMNNNSQLPFSFTTSGGILVVPIGDDDDDQFDGEEILVHPHENINKLSPRITNSDSISKNIQLPSNFATPQETAAAALSFLHQKKSHGVSLRRRLSILQESTSLVLPSGGKAVRQHSASLTVASRLISPGSRNGNENRNLSSSSLQRKPAQNLDFGRQDGSQNLH